MVDASLHQTLLIAVIAGIVIGFVGQVVPFFPSMQVIWLAILGYGLLTGFNWLSVILFAAITLILVGGSIVDQVLFSAGARAQGASWLSLGAGFVALLVGSLFWTPLGGLLASFGAVFLVEMLRLKDLRQALVSTKGMAIGCGWAAVARLAFNLSMVGLWLTWLIWIH